ncbi:DNA-binding transcriptional regulator, LysR family [Janthinobacterium sp. OK676]|uniref:LysR family transcriptional regulator n=1 Tax=Janthinobacterium sp. OK676 TaxID=1855295 RepID=UPI0008877CA6|nr:LysR family transcriptional regulator [Janthinobacterium sp. OK676]SDO24374.1 DNA-binding transcriptional regulator, LysR family [Janthinobacterium sp. OK676]
MNLRQLRYFCEVVEAGSATHAAERLHVAPTAISMQLGQLEAHLGGELFDRSRRPMEPTPLGRFFYPRAKELLLQAARLDDEAKGLATGSHGWLGIAFTRSATFSVLPRAIRQFRAAYPQVQLDLVEALSEYQPAQLRQGRIDIGLSRFIGPCEAPPDLRHAVTLDDPLVAALPLRHPLAGRTSLRAAELADIPFILYPKDPISPFGQQIVAALKAAGAEPAVAYSAVEIYTALSLVAAGLGATLVARSIAENNRTDVVFLPVDDIATSTTVVAVTRADEKSRLVSAFLEILAHGEAR